MYKKIYVEITNNCNLSCPFCTHNKRTNKFISTSEFQEVLKKIEGYTKYLYLHVLGEPLLHPHINELIDLAYPNFYINITTNGYLIKNVANNHHIRQLNISLHSFNPEYGLTLDEYLDNIFTVIDELKKDTYISFRLWVESAYSKEIIAKINKKYQKKLDYQNLTINTKLMENVFLNTHDTFIWPSMNNEPTNFYGTCYALRDHIAILVDGRVVPCCLDADGDISFGNIYQDELSDIIASPRYQRMLKSFKDNIKCENLCQRCNFTSKED